MQVFRLTLLLAASAMAAAQSTTAAPVQAPPQARQVWQMQDSGTTAGLRGVDSVDGAVAWASGTGGTVLRTIDGGAHWLKCAVPDAATDGATLDFRGVQAWDATTAIVMSSGKGKLSRLYRTRDGCLHWKLIFRNPDNEGFWDAVKFDWGQNGTLLGDPVNGMFSLFATSDAGKSWVRQWNKGLRVKPGSQGVFAASNSSLTTVGEFVFGSGGSGGAFMYSIASVYICIDDCSPEEMNLEGRRNKWVRQAVPLGDSTDSSGVFSVANRQTSPYSPTGTQVLVIVGGDYANPNESKNTAAYRLKSDGPWLASEKPPHGFRSAVQWSEALRAWIAVGTNGSDLSRDDGKTWQPLDDGNWNALSLPFVVGPNGRIARLNEAALPPAK
ncbi:MAG: WD40/YVTN/BNR-like repeat-containing protein [Terracidiphilus sp.]